MVSQIQNSHAFVPAASFIGAAVLVGSTRLIEYFSGASKEGLFLSAAVGGTLVAGTGFIRQRFFSEDESDLNRLVCLIASLAVGVIIAPYIAKSLVGRAKLPLKASFHFAIVEIAIVIGIEFFLQSGKSSRFVLLDEGRFKKYSTIGDGNCLIHALYGEFDSNGKIRLEDADACREKIAHEIFELNEEVQEFMFFEMSNGVIRENVNINNLALSLKAKRKYLGLEHAHMIAKLRKCNILVYNERTKKSVSLSCNPNSKAPDYFISYNGINHWSKCEFNTP